MSMISKKFLQSSLLYTIAGAMPLASGFVLLFFYLNYLTVEQFGLLALYIAFTAFIQLLMNFGFESYIGIHYIKVKDNPLMVRQYIGTMVVSMLLIGLFFILFFASVGELLFQWLFGEKGLLFYPWGMFSVLTAFGNSFFKTYTNLLINQQKSTRFFWMNSFNFVLTIGFSLAGLFIYPFTLTGPMWGRLLSGAGIFLLALYYFLHEYGLEFKKEQLRPLFLYCAPVLIYFLLSWVLGNIDRFIILGFMTKEDVAIFDFAMKCTLLIDFFQNGITYVVNPKVFSIIREENTLVSSQRINKYFNGFSAVNLLFIPLFVIAIPLLLKPFIHNEAYYHSFTFLGILSVGFVSRVWFFMFQIPLFYFNQTRALPKVFFFSALFQIVITLPLVRYFGIPGAVWASFLVKPAQAFFLYIASRKVYHFKVNPWKIYYLPVFYTLAVVSTTFFINSSNQYWIESGHLLLAILLVTAAYRKELLPFTRSLTGKK
ncbi:MAG TPA: oligosaccharide flippase family protein [Bacteroidales bacterium]|nr:oligosaccharide flippase family protein [Bacteroidales bacterium]HPT10445.1 oligosaccharide flippase family protein [Bacteroidales bacterium]